MSDDPKDPKELRRLTQKQVMKEKRRELYLKMKERTAPARKAAYEKQKAYHKAKRAEVKAKDKEAKAEEKRQLVSQRDEELLASLVTAEGTRPRLRLVEPLD